MEELYQLIDERISQIIQTQDKFSLFLTLQSSSQESSSAFTQELRDLSQFVSQVKRAEKVRVFKENELMESFYALKSFDTAQKKYKLKFSSYFHALY